MEVRTRCTLELGELTSVQLTGTYNALAQTFVLLTTQALTSYFICNGVTWKQFEAKPYVFQSQILRIPLMWIIFYVTFQSI